MKPIFLVCNKVCGYSHEFGGQAKPMRSCFVDNEHADMSCNGKQSQISLSYICISTRWSQVREENETPWENTAYNKHADTLFMNSRIQTTGLYSGIVDRRYIWEKSKPTRKHFLCNTLELRLHNQDLVRGITLPIQYQCDGYLGMTNMRLYCIIL